ncbi:MAG: ADOP family duplicated permease [Betaproteobacteria bacterium]
MARDWNALVRRRLTSLPLDPARAADVLAELAQHVADHHAELVAAGVPDGEALTRALAPLQDGDRVAAEIARADRQRSPALPPPPPARDEVFGGLLQDIRYALRLLARTPGFAAAAILTLALGIGANGTIFSVVNAVLLRPLPYADPGRLVMVGERQPDGAAGNVGYTTALDWRSRTHAFDEIALIRRYAFTLRIDGRAERLPGMRVSANYFHTLGVHPALGRDFRAADDDPAHWREVILTDAFWRRRFGADPSIVGRVLMMNDMPFTIVGILPPSFEPLISEHFYEPADMFSLVGYEPSLPYACRDCEHLKAIGRIKAGIARETARADLDAVQSALFAEYPTSYTKSTMTLIPLEDELNGGIRPALLVLMGAVALVLFIACANVASLFLARASERARDFALRTALGANRARLIRQLLVESALLALIGGSLGLFICAWGVPLLTHLSPVAISRLDHAQVDGRVLVFLTSLSLGSMLVFGLLPALRVSRVDLTAVLHEGARRTSTGTDWRARRVLVTVDVALAVVLLAGAGLMIRSVVRLLDVDPGFDPHHVLTMQTAFVGKQYAEDAATVRAVNGMIEALHRLPGVQAVATASQVPLGGNFDHWGFHVQGRTASNPMDDPSVERFAVTPGYFAAMRIPLRRGRLFTDADNVAATPVMVVGERTARRLWPDGDPIGQHVKIGGLDGPWITIVGVVGDVRHLALDQPPTVQMYVPEAQTADSYVTVVMRSDGDPSILTAEARRTIASVVSGVPVYDVAPLADLVARSAATRRFVMILLELFGGLALVLTAVGVYGVLSYSVTERRREIGIRAALGATPLAIVRLVLGGGLALVGGGLAIGVACALAATRLLRGGLYAVAPTDPLTFGIVLFVLFVVAVSAQAVPVARALRVDPAEALRE